MQFSLQGSVGRNRFTFLKENKATKLDIYMGMDNEFELEWHKSKHKELTLFFINKFNVWDFSTLFFSDLSGELARVKLYRNS